MSWLDREAFYDFRKSGSPAAWNRLVQRCRCYARKFGGWHDLDDIVCDALCDLYDRMNKGASCDEIERHLEKTIWRERKRRSNRSWRFVRLDDSVVEPETTEIATETVARHEIRRVVFRILSPSSSRRSTMLDRDRDLVCRHLLTRCGRSDRIVANKWEYPSPQAEWRASRRALQRFCKFVEIELKKVEVR